VDFEGRPAENQTFALPDWIDVRNEISKDPRYRNAELSKNPYEQEGWL
jgi:CYTH domain-containing protein